MSTVRVREGLVPIYCYDSGFEIYKKRFIVEKLWRQPGFPDVWQIDLASWNGCETLAEAEERAKELSEFHLKRAREGILAKYIDGEKVL